MKRILFAIIFASVLLQGAEVDVSGRWDSPTEMKNRDGQPVVLHMLLKQEGNKISGGVWTEDHDEDQPKPIQHGSIDGDKLRAGEVITFGNRITWRAHSCVPRRDLSRRLPSNWYKSQNSVETILDAADTECPRHDSQFSS